MEIDNKVIFGEVNRYFSIKNRVYKPLFSCLIFLLLIYYFFANIKSMEGVGNDFLFIVCISWFALILLEFKVAKRFWLKKSFFLLLIFLLHMLLRMLFTCDISSVRPYFFSTTGGILLFYFLGASCYMAMISFLEIQLGKTFLMLSLMILLLFSMGLALDCLLHHGANLRADIFLIDENSGNYQRPGDFATMAFLIISQFFVGVWVKLSEGNRFFRSLVAILYSITACLLIVLVQMIGSNKALLCVAGVFSVTVTFCIYHCNFSSPVYSCHKIRLFPFLLGKSARKAVLCFFAACLVAMVLGLSFLTSVGIDTSKLRVMNFGRSSDPISGAFRSRLGIIENNFLIQLSDSPLIGNMNVDAETTGKGSYAHSIPLYLMSHTGIFGLFLFMLYLIGAFVEFCRFRSSISCCLNVRHFKIFLLLSFFVIALIGVISSRLPWSPFWFVLGLGYAPFDMRWR